MKMLKFMKSNANWLSLALLVVILLSMQIARDWIPIGTEPYLYERLAHTQPAAGSFYDPYSFGGRLALENLGIAVSLGALSGIFGSTVFKLLPLLFGVLTAIIFILILKRFNLAKDNFIAPILVISPAFIYAFSSLNKYFFPVFLLILAFYLFMQKKPYCYFSLLPALLLPFFNFHFTIIFLAIIFAYSVWSEKKCTFLVLPVLLLLIFWFCYLAFASGALNLQKAQLSANSLLKFFISDFGNPAGIGLFALITAIFGLSKYWKRKYENAFLFLSFVFLLVYSFFRIEALIAFTFFIAIFVNWGLLALFQDRENLPLRNFTLLILVCGLLFSGLAGINSLISAEPDQSIMGGLDFLNSQKMAVAFSHYTRGNWLAYANKQTVADENMLFIPNLEERLNDSEALLSTRDLREANLIIDKYNIRYIWSDNSLRKQIWEGEEDGLQFLLKYSSMFKNIYNKGGVQIWEIEKETGGIEGEA